MSRGARVGADHPQLEAEGCARHHQMHEHDGRQGEQQAAGDGGSEQARQPIGHRQDAGLRHGRCWDRGTPA